jgi:acetylornithine/N-succinyldiaminopimelate aminotransferase
VQAGLEAGLVLNATAPATLRFLPPLIVEEQEIDRVLAFLEETL